VRFIGLRYSDAGIARLKLDEPTATGRPQAGQTTTYSYDSGGALTSRSDASGSFTYAYDEGGRLTTMKDAGGATVASFTYDAVGNCMTKAVTLGGATLTTTFTYDAANRMTTRPVR
jgi:YD repeat-containing protein